MDAPLLARNSSFFPFQYERQHVCREHEIYCIYRGGNQNISKDVIKRMSYAYIRLILLAIRFINSPGCGDDQKANGLTV